MTPERSLSDFGWNTSQSPAAQWAAAQSALDSGEPLTFLGTVVIDQPLVAQHCPSLRGFGADLTINAMGASQIVSSDGAIDILTVLKDHCTLSNFNLHRHGGPGTGRGVVIGDTTKKCVGVTLDRLSTNPYHRHGLHVQAMAKSNVDRCWWQGHEAAVRWQNIHGSDDGDNSIYGTRFLGWEDSYGLHWTSGGGLYIAACKFLFGSTHMYVDWNDGGSGNLTVTGCSFESNSFISVDMRGSFPFKRAHFDACTWGGVLMALAVRNFNFTPGDGGAIHWLESLSINGCTADTEFADNTPIIDVGCTKNALVTGNILRGYGKASCGIFTRNGSGVVGPNYHAGVPNKVINAGGWSVAAQY
jgi:hypothetical protein